MTSKPTQEKSVSTFRKFIPVKSEEKKSGKNTVPAYAQKAASLKPESKIAKFFRETKSELKKIAWPTRETTIRLTILVIIVSLVVGMFLGLIDLGFKSLFSLMLGT